MEERKGRKKKGETKTYPKTLMAYPLKILALELLS